MQFIPDGPKVPDNLISAHEEGRVVFFCGAGISVPAGLPNFKELAENISEKCNLVLPSDYQTIFDRVFLSMERNLPGKRNRLLEELWNELNINSLNNPQKHYHDSLLTLAQSKLNGPIQLVTTNFDRIFQACLLNQQKETKIFEAPLLPKPTPNRWDGIVYLHGLLPEKEDDLNENDNLVITSGDFGQAYLSEGWATRFLSELFKNFVICFVGYSLNDPIMIYLTEGLTNEVNFDQKVIKKYIFTKEGENIQEMKERGFQPILYYDHDDLERTLSKWANLYKKGLEARKEIIDLHSSQYTYSFEVTFIKDQLLWAIGEPEGTKYFANMNPCPPIDWLDAFESMDTHSVNQRCENDNHPENISSQFQPSQKYTFKECLFQCIFEEHVNNLSENISIINHLRKWIVRHLDKPYLAYWIAQKNKPIGKSLKESIINELKIEERNPNYIPQGEKPCDSPINKPMRKVWELFLTDSIKNLNNSQELHKRNFMLEESARNGLSQALKLELRKLFKPTLYITSLHSSYSSCTNENKKESIKDIFAFHVDFGRNFFDDEKVFIIDFLETLSNKDDSLGDMKFYFNLFTDTLSDMFCFIKWFCGNDLDSQLNFIFNARKKNKYVFNIHFKKDTMNWVLLIEILLKLWSYIAKNNYDQALEVLGLWEKNPHFIFQKLFLLCIKENSVYFNIDYVFEILIDEKRNLLHTSHPQYLNLLYDFSKQFKNDQLKSIQNSILKSVENKSLPDENFRSKFRYKDKQLKKYKKTRELYLIHVLVLKSLKKLKHNGATLTKCAIEQLNKYESDNNFIHFFTDTQLQENEFPTDNFSIEDWMQYLDNSEKRIVNYNRPSQYQIGSLLSDQEQQWEELCKKSPYKSFKILKQFYKKKHLINSRFIKMLNCWLKIASQKLKQNSEESRRGKIIYIASVTYSLQLEKKHFANIDSSIILLAIEIIPDFIYYKKDYILFELANKVINNSSKYDDAFEDIGQVKNHPICLVIQLIISYQHKKQPIDKGVLLDEVKSLLNTTIDGNGNLYVYGIAVIAHYTEDLYSYDSKWVEKKLLPLFNWKNKTKAKFAWLGYLNNASGFLGLFKHLHEPLLDTVNYLDDIKSMSDIYSMIICTIALDQIGNTEKLARIFSNKELNKCIKLMPSDQRSNMIKIIADKMNDANQNVEIYWDKSVKLFFKEIWPGEKHVWDEKMQLYFLNIVLASRTKFPEAVNLFYWWLSHGRELKQKIDFDLFFIPRLACDIYNFKTGECALELSSIANSSYMQIYPVESFKLLGVVVTQDNPLPPNQCLILREFLNLIKDKKHRDSLEFKSLFRLAENYF